MKSALYEGLVNHQRLKPKRHRFSYKVYQMYLDLDELESVSSLSRLCGQSRWAPLRFVRKDFHGDPSVSVKEAVYKTVLDKSGKVLNGPVRVLCNWRCFGFNFNPLSTYFCFDEKGEKVETVLAEVTNTPWLERHAYVFEADAKGHVAEYFDKAFTVSPFNPVNMQYDWFCSSPGDSLSIRIDNYLGNEKVFHASMGLKRETLSRKSIKKVLRHFPVMSLKVVLAIYWQALRLFVKRVPYLGKDKFAKNIKLSSDKVNYENDSRSI